MITINIDVKFRIAGITLGRVRDSFALPALDFLLAALLPVGVSALVHDVRGVTLTLTRSA